MEAESNGGSDRGNDLPVKFVMAVLQEQDVDSVLDVLREYEFGVSRFVSPGRFRLQPIVNLLIGVSEQRVEEVVELLREHCHRHRGIGTAATSAKAGCVAMGSWGRAGPGGAGVFVLNLERFERL